MPDITESTHARQAGSASAAATMRGDVGWPVAVVAEISHSRPDNRKEKRFMSCVSLGVSV